MADLRESRDGVELSLGPNHGVVKNAMGPAKKSVAVACFFFVSFAR